MDAWQYWEKTLGSPRLILAPMVDHSELPWRMLSREYGCHLAYTPMFHAANFASSKKYRDKYFTTAKEDRPLIVQFCANNPQTLLEAAKHVADKCDGIDINLGCPQEIARRGRYGAFIQEDWELIKSMIQTLRQNFGSDIGVSCKIRRLDDLNKTIEYAQMLEEAGCTFVGIHARTREQRGVKTGSADWNYIRAVKDSVSIPVVANGNIQSLKDAEACLEYTGADAIMTAEGNLYNPGLFLNTHYPGWMFARKYLDYVKTYPIPAGMAKSHLFKLFHRCVAVEDNLDIRIKLGQSTTLEQLYEAIDLIEEKYAVKDCDQSLPMTVLPVPPFLCQPRYRYQVEQPHSDSPKNNDVEGDNDADKIVKKIKL